MSASREAAAIFIARPAPSPYYWVGDAFSRPLTQLGFSRTRMHASDTIDN